jgi:hypothetical protein
MTEQELRTLVRQAIARAGVARAPTVADAGRLLLDPLTALVPPSRHVSHGMFALPDGADADGPCLIEPAVGCNHCGYCKSLGH